MTTVSTPSAPAVRFRVGNEKLIRVLPGASARLLSLLKKQGREEQGGLRVAVVGGGCSGLQYKMDLVDGPANRDILVESNSVRVVIDPGHGGPDPGAVGIGDLRETDVVLDVGLQVAQLLQARGVQVLMTRTSEVDVDLPPRVALANRSGADVFVSLHANALSMGRPDVNGIETFYFEGGRSRGLAELIQERLLAISPGTVDRGARPGRFFVIRRTVMPSVLTEMGFVTGEIDAPRLADANYRRRLAQAVAGGILTYLQQ